jgi:hypothetical protein
MGNEDSHEVQIVGSSIDEINEILGLSEEDVKAGSEVRLTDDMVLTVSDVSKSSGFAETALLLTGLVTIVTSTSSALLVEWLKSRLFESGKSTNVTIIIDGQELRPGTGTTHS